jgi:hypothetical protein
MVKSIYGFRMISEKRVILSLNKSSPNVFFVMWTRCVLFDVGNEPWNIYMNFLLRKANAYVALYISVASSSSACLHFIHHKTPWILGFHHGETHFIRMKCLWGEDDEDWFKGSNVRDEVSQFSIVITRHCFQRSARGPSLTLWPGPDPVWGPGLCLVSQLIFDFGPASYDSSQALHRKFRALSVHYFFARKI